jgi:surfeit locus 1 family protein
MSFEEPEGAPIPWNEFRPTVGSTIAAIICFAILLGLGTWQMVRLDWKTDLIAERTARLEAPPIALPTDDAALSAAMWAPVSVTGRFLHDQEILLAARSQRGNVGVHVLTPMVREEGPTVLINRGWVPDARRDPATRAAAQVEGPVTVVGLVTPGAGRNAFTPDNDPATNFWLSVDYPAMAAVVGRALQPVVIDADATPNEGGFPLGGQTRLDIPNDHLQYAITWYLLALTLVAVYIGWNRKRMRERQAKGE